MTRKEATQAVIDAKKSKGLTWEEIAEAVGGHKVWVTSALLGQNSLSEEEAKKAVDLLGLDAEIAKELQICPMKGSLENSTMATQEPSP